MEHGENNAAIREVNYGSQGRKKEINKKSTYILSIISNASSRGNAGATWGTPISLNG